MSVRDYGIIMVGSADVGEIGVSRLRLGVLIGCAINFGVRRGGVFAAKLVRTGDEGVLVVRRFQGHAHLVNRAGGCTSIAGRGGPHEEDTATRQNGNSRGQSKAGEPGSVFARASALGLGFDE